MCVHVCVYGWHDTSDRSSLEASIGWANEIFTAAVTQSFIMRLLPVALAFDPVGVKFCFCLHWNHNLPDFHPEKKVLHDLLWVGITMRPAAPHLARTPREKRQNKQKKPFTSAKSAVCYFNVLFPKYCTAVRRFIYNIGAAYCQDCSVYCATKLLLLLIKKTESQNVAAVLRVWRSHIYRVKV